MDPSSSRVSAQGTTTKARARRPGKAALGRVKLAAISFSIMAFTGALGGIAVANPAVKTQSAAQVANEAPAIVLPAAPVAPTISSVSSAPLALPAVPQAPSFRPRARTRGS